MASSGGYQLVDYTYRKASLNVLPGSVDVVCSSDMILSENDCTNFGVLIEVSDLSVGVGEEVTVQLQQVLADGIWDTIEEPQGCVLLDNGDGLYGIFLSVGIELESLVLPLSNRVRLIITTGATSSVTVESVQLLNKGVR